MDKDRELGTWKELVGIRRAGLCTIVDRVLRAS